jgi:hypothetical protein
MFHSVLSNFFLNESVLHFSYDMTIFFYKKNMTWPCFFSPPSDLYQISGMELSYLVES